MPDIDWLTALGATDQSLESNMARRDVSKLQQMLMNAVNEKAQREQFGEQMELRRKTLAEEMAQRREAQAYRMQQADELKRTRQIDDDRMRASQLLAADPGTIYQQPEVEFLTKAGHGGQLTPQEGGGAMFQRRQFEEAQAKLATEIEKAKRQEKYQAENAKIQQSQEARAQRGEQRAIQREQQISKTRALNHKALEQRLQSITDPFIKQEATQKAIAFRQNVEKERGFMGVGGESDDEFEIRVQQGLKKIYDDARAEDFKKRGGITVDLGVPGTPSAVSPAPEAKPKSKYEILSVK